MRSRHSLPVGTGIDGRRESAYVNADKNEFPQQSAQNPNIITAASCNNLLNRCGLNNQSPGHVTCLLAQAAVQTLTARDGNVADTWNAAFVGPNSLLVASCAGPANRVCTRASRPTSLRCPSLTTPASPSRPVLEVLEEPHLHPRALMTPPTTAATAAGPTVEATTMPAEAMPVTTTVGTTMVGTTVETPAGTISRMMASLKVGEPHSLTLMGRADPSATSGLATPTSTDAGTAATAVGGGDAGGQGQGNAGANAGDLQTSLTIDPSQIQSNQALTGNEALAAGQSASKTSVNNFANFCATRPDLPLTNGQQGQSRLPRGI